MKTLFLIVFLSGISFAALAQCGQVTSRGGAKTVYIIRPQVIVGAYSPFLVLLVTDIHLFILRSATILIILTVWGTVVLRSCK
jgi:hypothetical protein